jgi:outer membrane receptor protein involved in Fe transport
MKRITTIIIIIILPLSLWAQALSSISGRITDKKTGEILPGVNVVIEKLNLGIATNSKGAYLFKNIPLGKHKLSVSFIGYSILEKEIELKSSRKLQLNFLLEKQSQNLKQVTVTGKSEARKIRELAMPITVISMSQLSGTVNSISDVLNKSVGITMRNSGGVGSASRLSVRGLEGKRIGFFIDETPMNDNSDFIDINDIPMDMIERIEIYKGVIPAKFGGNAMGGAVNIVIKEYPNRYADFSYTLESFNTHKTQAVLKRNFKDKGLVIGGGGFYTYSDNNYTMESPYVEGLKIKRKHDKFKKLTIAGTIEATKLWFDKIVFEPVFINTQKEIQGIEYDIREAHTKSQAYILANSFEKDNFFIEGLDFDWSNAVAYTKYSLIDTAMQWHDWEGIAYNSDSEYGGELGNRYASNSDNKKFTYMNKLNLEYLINEKHSINFNSSFTLADGKPKDELRELSLREKTIFDSKMRSWVVGFTYDYRTKDDRFLNSLTSRYYLYTMNTKSTNMYGLGEVKDVALNKNDIGFSDAMRYRFTTNFLAKISAGYDVRIPSETELLGNGMLIEPSESLLPERNTSVNVGVMYSLLGTSKSNLQLELSGFYMHLEDMIRFTKSPWGGAKYQNFGEMQTLGVEFEAKADILSVLYGYGNITYQDLRDVRGFKENSTIPNPSKNMRMPNIPYLFANVGLEFHKENLLGGTGQNTRIFADLAFVEEYLYDFKMTNDQRRIPRSTTVDLGFEHSFMNERLFISGKMKNLTDANILSEFNRPLPGRILGIKLRYIFK